MRNTIRIDNIWFFINKNHSDFDIYQFIIKIISNFTLSGAPKWRMNKGVPIEVPLIQMIKELFDYGLISYKFTWEIVSQLYLVTEIINSLEININKENMKDPYISKYEQEFVSCRENISYILIHIITIFCDVSFEESLHQLKTYEKFHVWSLFKKFLFKDTATYNYFSHIVLKYLS